uniref:Heme-copper oxidase subunit III family profile domain-containing protein n=1 Tax=Schlesneria paludicola TaxID=360056 RepID=A0A7C4LME4_9PLAN
MDAEGNLRVSRSSSESRQAVQFFGVALASFTAALGLGWGLATVCPPSSFPRAVFPPIFALSTVVLGLGSLALSRAVEAVRGERQQLFRRRLRWALYAGILFVGAQFSGLRWLIARQAPEEAATGVGPFVAVVASLHAVHFIVALLFLAFVLVRAAAGRYDHEYYWGVTVCAWFWHVLGVAWLVVLGVMALAGW